MTRPARLALGVLFAATGALACSDSDTVAGPDESSALRARHALSVPSAEPGPITTRLSPNYCVDVSGGSAQAGAAVVLNPCAPSAASQQFSWQSSGEVRVFETLCLEALPARGRDGNTAVAQTCRGVPSQQWTYTAAGEMRDGSGSCVEVKSARAGTGVKLLMRACDASPEQQWNVRTTIVDGSTPADTAPADTVPTSTTPPADTAAPAPSSPVVVVGAVGAAELPRGTMTVQAPAVTGTTINVAAGQSLQAAIDAAKPGDEIVLAAGATFTGNFVLKAKSGDAWITIRSSASLPPAGTRVTPATAAGFAKVVTPNMSPAIATEPGAHHYRIAGLDIGAAAGVTRVYSLVNFGDGGAAQKTLSLVPRYLILDRAYVHGTATLDVRRCVGLNSAWSAVVDSYLGECHSNDGEAQAIWGANGPGPYTIQNNSLEGSGENVMFGGSDPQSAELVPSDITIRGNHIRKPLTWQGKWMAKNLIELKLGKRVLIENNVIENSWVDAQTGFAMVLWSVNQGGAAPWSETSDVTVRHNVIRHAAHAFQLSPSWGSAVPMARVTIAHNLITGIGTDAAMGGGGQIFQVQGAIADLALAHNTAQSKSHWLYFPTQPITPLPRMQVLDNVAFYVGGLALRSDYDNGANAWTTYAGNSGGIMVGNVLAAAVGGLPPNNSAPVLGSADATAAIGFVNAAGGDYHLASSSPFKSKGTDGTDPGANIDALNSRTQGVALP